MDSDPTTAALADLEALLREVGASCDLLVPMTDEEGRYDTPTAPDPVFLAGPGSPVG
jgi:hypothetical protein